MRTKEPSHLGRAVKRLAEAQDISLREVARRAGLRSEGHVAQIISGAIASAEISTITKLAAALGVSASVLLAAAAADAA
jgi:transcriptional regulator with XRE-family HTH domain